MRVVAVPGVRAFAMIDRQRGKLDLWRGPTREAGPLVTPPQTLVVGRDLVRASNPATSDESRTWDAIVAILRTLGVVVEEQT